MIISLDQRHGAVEQEIRTDYQLVKDEIRNKVSNVALTLGAIINDVMQVGGH